MAVRKATKKEEVTKVEVSTEEVDSLVDNDTVEVDETPEVEVSVEKEEPKVEVDVEVAKEKVPVKREVRIRVQKDHRCFIGGELYDLKKGSCYNVPEFVKKTLNKAGILAPL